MRLNDLVCPFCLGRSSALRFDRKSRPYFTCAGCGGRAFLPALRDALRSLALVQPLLEARVDELESDRQAAATAAAAEAQVSAAFKAMMRARPEHAASAIVVQQPAEVAVR